MTAAEESVRAGRLAEALTSVQAQVKKQPGDPKLRVFLFQLLAVMGQWERAATQLEVVGELDPATLEMARTYGAVLACERLRASVFAGHTTPLLFGEPSSWMALLIKALQLMAQGKLVEARALRDKAFEDAPTTAGTLTVRSPTGSAEDHAFSWIADADPRLGPVLEVIVNGKYYWLPFERVRELALEAPTDLRDLAWTPAVLTFANGGETVAFIPTRYPGSEAAPDAAVVAARSTVWTEQGPELFVGLGQRVLATDAGEHGLMDVRRVRLEPSSV